MDNELHPSTLALLPFFEYDHLPDPLADVSRRFFGLAHDLVDDARAGDLDAGAELTPALRKLLEAKDCAVRAALVATEGGRGDRTRK